MPAGGARNQPFHPAMMVKLLVYGYATGVFSSRKIERRLHDDLAFRMLGAGNFPKHRTIRDFRALHLLELSDLFVQVVKLAREMGLVKLGTVAIDGTKIKVNASRHKAMNYERVQQAQAELKAQIAALLKLAKTTDAAEADEPELDVPAEIERREARLNEPPAGACQCADSHGYLKRGATASGRRVRGSGCRVWVGGGSTQTRSWCRRSASRSSCAAIDALPHTPLLDARIP